jgi:hypothetical protein
MSFRLAARPMKGLAVLTLAALAAASVAAPVVVWRRETRVTIPELINELAALRFAGATTKGIGASKLAVRRGQRALPNTYLDVVIVDRDSTLERWPARVGAPIRVWVADGSKVRGWRQSYVGAVHEAFDDWSTAGVPVRFAFVADSANAEIKVRWKRSLSRRAAGLTQWWSDRDRMMGGADITLAINASNGRAMDRRGVKAVALHEVGHALGIGHSPGRRDIMAPWVTAERLSSRDRATARLLYALPAGRITD